MIDLARLPQAQLPTLDALPAFARAATPTALQQSAFERRLASGWPAELQPPSIDDEWLSGAIQRATTQGERILETLERLRESLDARLERLEGRLESLAERILPPAGEPAPGVTSVTVERSDGQVVNVTVKGDGNTIVETRDDGSTLVAASNVPFSVNADLAAGTAFMVASGDRILASLAQIRAELA